MSTTSSKSTDQSQSKKPVITAANRPVRRNHFQKSSTMGILGMVQTFLAAAFILATLFTLWTPANLFSNQMLSNMWLSMQSNGTTNSQPLFPTSTVPTRLPIGIVAGHWKNDSGAVCPDGLTEVEINLQIATLVRQKLIQAGYDVDLLAEFDELLFDYQALALVSIHNDSCDYINDEATGYKVAAALSTIHPEKANRLTACMTHYYQNVTGLSLHQNTITSDMTYYHAFEEIDERTPAVIIEAGFMNLDRLMLTEQQDLVAQGITEGILCYIENKSIPE